MNIYIAGTQRCGSTRLYNLIIYLCEYKSDKVTCGFNKKLDPNSDYNIIKTHNTKQPDENASLIFFPVRDIRDAFVSAKDSSLFTSVAEYFVGQQMGIYTAYMNISDLIIIKYEEYGLDECKRVAKILDIDIPESDLIKIMDNVSNNHNKNYDKFLVKPNHGTDRKSGKYKTRLSEEEIKYIDEYCYWYQKRFEYIS